MSSGKRIGFSVIFLSFLVLLGVCLFAAGLLLERSGRLYGFIKSNEHGFEGRIFRPDPALGHAPVPDSMGEQIFPIGPGIPIRFDHDGFRVPVDHPSSQAGRRPLVLALGCSSTFGAACRAERTYPYLVGEGLNGTSLNAGVPGYGLSQMLILAQRLIPKYRPDFVLVQYSPWLVDRAMSPFAPSWIGVLPSPFITTSPDDRMKVYPPVFRSKSFDLDISRFRHTPKSVTDFLDFLHSTGLPLYGHDWSRLFLYHAGRLTGAIPAPCRDPGRITEFVYTEIKDLCASNNSRMIIVVLTDPGLARKPTREEISALRGLAMTVNTEPALLDRLPIKDSESYDHAYRLYRGGKPVLVDRHPNEKSHQIIADEILNALRTFGDLPPNE